MTTTEIPCGIYHIILYNETRSDRDRCLTRIDDKYVDFTQFCKSETKNNLWEIIPDEVGNITIKVPKENSYLTYEFVDDLKKLKMPKTGMAVVYLPSEKSPNQWQFVTAVPGYRYFLRVAGSTLGVKVAPQPIRGIHKLELGCTDQLKWVFELVSKE